MRPAAPLDSIPASASHLAGLHWYSLTGTASLVREKEFHVEAVLGSARCGSAGAQELGPPRNSAQGAHWALLSFPREQLQLVLISSAQLQHELHLTTADKPHARTFLPPSGATEGAQAWS
ncbi:unnamed protein product [Arctogadus glacialis]